MVSNRKSESKNIYLQTLIAEILRTCEDETAKSITEIRHQLESKYDYFCAYKTIARNIKGMSDSFKLSEVGERPVRYWIDSYYEPDFSIELNPFQIQLITYALRGLANQSTKPLAKALKDTEAALLNALPIEVKKELKYALKSYQSQKSTSKPVSYPKNNINEVFRAIRKKKLIKAKLKLPKLSEKQRHIMRTLTIKHIEIKQGLPVIQVFDHVDQIERTINATQLNSIQLLEESPTF